MGDSLEGAKYDPLYVLKFRCDEFLNPGEFQNHKEWVKESCCLAKGKYNLINKDDGENYYVDSQLERRFIGDVKISYKLSFSDMDEFLEDDKYSRLKELGDLVFKS